jgi:YggT family protein
MTNNFALAGVYVIQTVFGLYVMVVMLRFLMQVARADYYNPICQGIIKITEPALRPFAKIIPSVRGVNFGTLVLAFAIQLLAIILIMLITGNPIFHPIYAAWVAVGLFSMIFDIYFWALIIMVIASWIAPTSSHPALTLVYQLTEPVCAPARKLLPPMGGLDLSIILVFIFITIIDKILVIAPLAASLKVPRGLIMGL